VDHHQRRYGRLVVLQEAVDKRDARGLVVALVVVLRVREVEDAVDVVEDDLAQRAVGRIERSADGDEQRVEVLATGQPTGIADGPQAPELEHVGFAQLLVLFPPRPKVGDVEQQVLVRVLLVLVDVDELDSEDVSHCQGSFR
jgi:hypothetical protein